MSNQPLTLTADMLTRLAKLGEPHHHAQLEAVRAEFGDDDAVTLHTLLIAMQLGNVLSKIPNAERAPEGIASVWSLMRVPFTLEAKRVQ